MFGPCDRPATAGGAVIRPDHMSVSEILPIRLQPDRDQYFAALAQRRFMP